MSTTTAPAYNADVAPPSYDEVVKKLEGLVGKDPTPRKYLDAAGKLSVVEIQVIEKNAEKHPPIGDHQKEEFAIGAAATLSEDTEDLVKDKAEAAIDGAAKIRTIFSTLGRKIKEIDLIQQSEFGDELETHNKTFDKILEDSQTFATTLAVSAMDFEDVVLEFCADTTQSLEDRKTVIAGYIDGANNYKDKAKQIKNDFNKLETDMNTFKAKFATWAQEKEGDLEQDIKDLQDDIQELNKELATIRKAMVGIGIGAAVALPALAVIAALSGPLAPFVAIGGLIALGATAAAIAGLAIRAAVIENEIKAKQNQIKSKQDEIKDIQNARVGLKDLGEEQMVEFSKNMFFLTGFWNATMQDAITVKEWLEKGATSANIPPIMKARLQNGAKVYKKMAVYLRMYASGIRGFGINK